MEPLTVIIGLVVGGLFVSASPSLYEAYHRHWVRRRALRDRCLACDSLELERKDQDGSFVCAECGYDSRWAEDVRKAREIRALTELDWALEELRSARKTISLVPGFAEPEYDEAGPRIMAAIEIMERWMGDHPQLAGLSLLDEGNAGIGVQALLIGVARFRMRRELKEAIALIESTKKEIGARLTAQSTRRSRGSTPAHDRKVRTPPPRERQ